MKKLCCLPVLLCLCACDTDTIVGKCLPHERTVTSIEQNGKIVKTSTVESFICGCFENIESDTPQFAISTDEFSFETSDTLTANESNDSAIYTERITKEDISGDTKITDKSCNKQCTKLCKKHLK